MIILLSLQTFILIYLTLQDLKTKRVSLGLLLAITGLTLLAPLFIPLNLNYPLALFTLTILVVLKLIFFLLKGRSLMGNGDFLLLFPLLLCLQLSELPLFLIASGVLGVATGKLWHFIFKEKQSPFIPALSLSYLLCLVLRYL